MKPDKFTIFELFERERRYLVPLYQRPYVWTEDQQWEPLWQDLAEKAEALLDHDVGDREPVRNHFMGAVVLNHLETYGRQVAAAEVIDGQQRLTTLQIFLPALRDLAKTTHDSKLLGGLNRVTENDCLMQHEYERFKVWPTNADRGVFEAVMSAGARADVMRLFPQRVDGRKAIPRERLAEAYLFFSKRIEEFCRSDSHGNVAEGLDTNRLATLFQVLRRNVQLVVIELERDDDPQVIFETLNARGQPLLPSDLIRNFTFLQANRRDEQVDRLYTTYWKPYDELSAELGASTDEPFWKQPEQQGRILRPRIDLFFFQYLTFQAEREVNIGHLFQEYREWWMHGRETRSVEDELARLKEYSEIFQMLVVPDEGTRVGAFIRRLRTLDTTTVYPLLFMLLGPEYRKRVSGLDLIVSDLESFLVRRMACGLTTKNYNRLFLSILRKLKATEEITPALLREELLAGTGDAVRWPEDREFRRNLLFSPLYTRLKPHRVSMLLQAIERALRTSKNEDVRIANKLSVEHVMPQDYRVEDYPLRRTEDGTHEDLLARRAEMLHSIGNLTLVTNPLNSSLGKASFSRKRREIAGNSLLRLNRYFQDLSDEDVWDEEAITRRAEQLFAVARQIWPYPVPDNSEMPSPA